MLLGRIARLREWMLTGNGRLYQVELRLTQRCNLRCRFCYTTVATYDTSKEMEKETILKAVADSAHLGAECWVISSDGEPTYRLQDCLSIMRSIKSHGMHGSMITNGTMLTADAIEEMVSMGWDHLIVSIDSADAAVHDYLRGVRGALARTISTVMSIQKARARLRSRTPAIDLQTVINSLNMDSLEGTLRLAASLGAQSARFQPVVHHEGTDSTLQLTPGDVIRLKSRIPSLLREAESLGIETNLGEYLGAPLIENTSSMLNVLVDQQEAEHPVLRCPCYEPWYFIAIRADGSVDPCAHVRGDPESTLTKKSLVELWQGSYFNTFRSRISRGKMFKECRKCCAVGVIQNRELKQALRGDLYAIRSKGLSVPTWTLGQNRAGADGSQGGHRALRCPDSVRKTGPTDSAFSFCP